jgi:putative hydrolase of the HAD superfamily
VKKLQPKAVIFDLGSTLIEYESVSWPVLGRECSISARKFLIREGYAVPDCEAFADLFETCKEPYRQRAAAEYVEWSVPAVACDLLQRLNIKSQDNLIDRLFDAYYEPVDKKLFVYDDTVETLTRLKSRFDCIGLISNTVFPERAHRAELKKFGIEPFLSFTLFSSNLGIRKPHPDVFLRGSREAGFAPEECVYIGDRYLEDITGPSSIGMPAILKITANREYPAEFPEGMRSITTLSELENHFDI